MSTLPNFTAQETSAAQEPASVQPGQQTAIPIPPAPQAAPQKNKGGRPKGAKNKPKTPPGPQVPPTPATSTAEEELQRLAAEYRPVTPPAGAAQPGQPAAAAAPTTGLPFVITGHLALIVVDTFIPSGMAFVLNRYGWKVTPDQLKLTEKERQDIEPIMDAVVKQLTADPRVILLLALVGAYAGKIPAKPARPKADVEAELKEALAELKRMRDQMNGQ